VTSAAAIAAGTGGQLDQAEGGCEVTFLDSKSKSRTRPGGRRPAAGPVPTARSRATARPAALLTMPEIHREVAAELMRRGKSDSMLCNVARAVERLVHIGIHTGADLANLSAEDFKRYIADWPDPRSMHLTLQSFARYAFELGLIPSPVRMPKGPRRLDGQPHPPPPRDDVQRLLDHAFGAAARSWGDYRSYVMTAALVRTGLSWDLLLGILVDDVDLEAGTIGIRRGGAILRTIRIPSELRPVLARWIPLTGCPWLFPGDTRSGPWHRTRAKLWLRQAAREADVPAVGDIWALRQFFAATWVPEIPGLKTNVPPSPRGTSGPPSSVRLLSDDDATRFMVALREDSATWEGDRVLVLTALALFAGLGDDASRELRRADVRLHRSPVMLAVAGRKDPVVLDEDAGAGILRRWLTRPDQIDSPYVLPGWDGGRWGVPKSGPYRTRFQRAADRAGITARVTLTDLIRVWKRCAFKVELGAAWRDGRPPEPIATGPTRRRGKAKGKRDASRPRSPHARRERRPDLTTWDLPVPAVQIKGPDDPVYLLGEDKGVLPFGTYEAIRILMKYYPERVRSGVMDDEYGGSGWRPALHELRKADDSWRRGISFPDDEPGLKGYGILGT
jgi:integrase